MKRFKWSIILGLVLLSISFLLYFINYLVFGNPQALLARALGSLAFVPIQGLVVTLFIAELLVVMGKRSRLQKMKMVIGVFFSELGTKLLSRFCESAPDSDKLCTIVESISNWSAQNVPALTREMEDSNFETGLDRQGLLALKEFLVSKRSSMARLLENPNLLEDESFTEMLWAVFHLTEELDARTDLAATPDTDFEHLRIDASRAYGLLLREWLYYMKHLNQSYPFLFSFAIRTNPLASRSVEVV